VNSKFEEWLNRSLVCITYKARDLATLTLTVINIFGQCTKICALSSFKFILTFPTIEQIEETLKNHEELDLWFRKSTNGVDMSVVILERYDSKYLESPTWITLGKFQQNSSKLGGINLSREANICYGLF